jgi:protein phosphatase
LGVKELRAGDRFVLCSDGLNSQVEDEDILHIVEEAGSDLDAAARALVESSNAAGGDDNVTVIVVEAVVEAD